MPHYRRNLFLSAVIVFWMLGLLTWVTWVTFTDPPDIPTGTATLVGVVYGLPALAVGLWKWRGEQIKGDR